MSELESALDGVLAVDLGELADAATLERVGVLVAARNRLDAALAMTVRHAEVIQAPERDGLTSMRSWLVGHQLLSRGEAGRIVAAGRTLEKLPLLADAAAEGEVSAGKVAEAGQVTVPTRWAAVEAAGADVSEIDAALAVVGANGTHADVVAVVARCLAVLDPDGPEPDPTEGRRLVLATHPDGRVTGRFDLDPIGGEKLKTAVEAIVQADRPAGDVRNRAQQQGDALVQIMDNQLAAGGLPTLRREKPHLIVTIPVEDLIDPDPTTGTTAGTTGFGEVISAARARWLACDATVSRIVLGPEGTPLDLGRRHRVVTPALRRAVVARDRTCVFTGCDNPHWWADVHHLVHWIDGGDTSLANSALLCERHHTQVHHGFTVARDPDRPPGQQWRTWRPDGTEIIIGPRIADLAPPAPPPPPREWQPPSVLDVDKFAPDPSPPARKSGNRPILDVDRLLPEPAT